MKIKKIIPIIIFIMTLIIGIVLIFTSEQVSQKKAGLISKNAKACPGLDCIEPTDTPAPPPACPASPDPLCPNKISGPTPYSCPNGSQGFCTTTTRFATDIAGCPGCYTCVADQGCTCPTPTLPPPTATPTPIPTVPVSSPTPSPIPTNSPTPTPTTPINSPTPTPTPTVTPTGTPPPTPTSTNAPTLTPVPVICGTKGCDNTTNPCRSGYICVQANDGSNYCTSSDFQAACKASPTYNNCCTAPGAPTATPTEIIIAKTSPVLLKTGTQQSFIYFIPALIMLAGLIL